MDNIGTTITIVHFNDVYNIQPRAEEPVGGAARFATALELLAPVNPLVLFSGDALNPSMMSTITKGKQMVPLLNEIKVACAVCGNHDFDHGVDNLVQLISEMTFPWLLSNVYDPLTDKPLADALPTHIVDWQGVRIGLLGLVERDWLETLSTVNPEDVEFRDYVEEGQRLCKELREQGAEYIIALTHMRWPNDTRLAECVEDIDLILGGHDHDFIVRQINGKYVVKSGTDFRNFALVTLKFPRKAHLGGGDCRGLRRGEVEVSVEERLVTSDIAENEKMRKIVDEYTEIVGAKMEAVIGQIYVDMDGRFSSIRHHETNLGNFIADIMLAATKSDIALVNAGSLRSDTIHRAGDFKTKDLMSIIPMTTPLVVLEITGSQLLIALNNGVSKYPSLEGRFPQVAGVSFTFEASRPTESRVVEDSIVLEGGVRCRVDQTYRLVTTSYLYSGRDGYDVFQQCPVLINEEDGPQLGTIVKNHFLSAKFASGERAPKYQHWQSIISNAKRHSLMTELTSDTTDSQTKMAAAIKMLKSAPVAGPLPTKLAWPTTTSSLGEAKKPTLTDSLNEANNGGPDMSDGGSKRARLTVTGRWQNAKASVIESRNLLARVVEQAQARAALSPRIEGRIICINDPSALAQ